MTGTEETAADADRRVSQLRADHDVDVVVERFPVDADRLAELRADYAAGGALDGGAAWVTDGRRVLLVRPREHPDVWTVPGRGREAGEDLAATAALAVREVTGVVCAVGDPFLVHRMVFASDEGGEFHAIGVYFDATYRDHGVPLRGSEVVETDWFETPPDDLHSLLADRVAARKGAAQNPDAGG